MVQVVVLGGGFAGVSAARELARLVRRAAPGLRIVLVSERADFVFRPSLPWVLVGQRRPEDIQAPLTERMARVGVEVVVGAVEGVNRHAGSVWLQRRGRLPYDYLIVALGAQAHWPWPGTSEHTLHVLWPEPAAAAAQAIRRAVEAKKSRGVSIAVVLAPGSPLYCPAYETVLLLHDHLTRLGLRRQSRLHLVTPEEHPFQWAGVRAAQVVGPWVERCGIEFHAAAEPARFEPGRVVLRRGGSLRVDRTLLFPPYRGPSALRGMEPLLDREGFVVVSRCMRSLADERVFAAGDVISAVGPKTGHMAENQGVVAAREVARAIRGNGTVAAWDSRLVCVMDGGGLDRGLFLMARPKPGEAERPVSHVFSGAAARWAKQALERYYLAFRV